MALKTSIQNWALRQENSSVVGRPTLPTSTAKHIPSLNSNDNNVPEYTCWPWNKGSISQKVAVQDLMYVSVTLYF